MTGVDVRSDAASVTSEHALTTYELPNRDWHGHRDRDTALSVETLRADATGALVQVSGELDMATAAPLWAVLQSHLGAGRRYLRLDLSSVTFLDASALTAIARVHRDALAMRGTLVLTGVRAVTARVMQMTGLDEVLLVGGPRAAVVDDGPLSVRPDATDRTEPASWTAAS